MHHVSVCVRWVSAQIIWCQLEVVFRGSFFGFELVDFELFEGPVKVSCLECKDVTRVLALFECHPEKPFDLPIVCNRKFLS